MRSHVLKTMAGAAALAFGLAAGSGGAHASIVQYTYTGTVDYGYDHAGIFGLDRDLTGKIFSLVEWFDTERNSYRWVGDAQSLQFGGTSRGTADSAGLRVTIGGVSRSIADVEDYIYSGTDTGKHQDFVKDASGYEYAGFYVQSPDLKADYGSALRLDASQATFIGNYQFFSTIDPDLATYASFNVASLTVTAMSTVPLPGSVALLGASLVLLAAGTWVRRRVAGAGRG